MERAICIMAGGSGERFWPMSRRHIPKHLLKLLSNQTLLEATARRALEVVPVSQLFVLTNEVQAAEVRQSLPFLPPDQVIVEPAKRDTAPAAALATAWVHARNPDSILALLPADAWINNHEVFAAQLRSAFDWLEKNDAFFTFAVKPDHPATGYGYLEIEGGWGEGATAETVRPVKKFVEKPDLITAQRYLESGHYGWNAGIFLWRTQTFLQEADRLVPELAAFIRGFPKDGWGGYLAREFPKLPKISVDYAVMEKATRVVAMRAAFDWDDVGTWTALPRHLPQDADGNTSVGTTLAVASENNIVVSNGRIIALCGVSDLVVVEMPDAVLVCHRDKVQDVKKLLGLLPEHLG